MTTILEKSHHDPVYDIYWLAHGKTGTECVSTSTDGRLLWWDYRKLDEGPIDEFVVNVDVDGKGPKVLGGTRIEYNNEAGPMKYLVGTEQGYTFQVNKRPGREVEINQKYGLNGGKHHGPIYAIQRNPALSKYFLTVGDWTAKIWSEDLKTPLMQTKYHNSYLTDGCWSPHRRGLFFLTRMDGFIDIWDYLYRQNEVAYSYKISDNPLTSISISLGEGKMAAVGDSEGSVTMIQLCKPLYQEQANEKDLMQQIFEREGKREKNLEVAKRLAGTKKEKVTKDTTVEEAKRDQKLQEEIRDLEAEFFKKVGDDDKMEHSYHRDEPKEEEKAQPPAEPSQHEPSVKEPSQHEPSQHEPSQHEPSQKDPSQHDQSQLDESNAGSKVDASQHDATPKSTSQKQSEAKVSEKGDATPVSAKSGKSGKSAGSKQSSKKSAK